MRYLPNQKDFLCTRCRNDVMLFLPNITLLMWGKFWGVFSAKWPRGVLLAAFLPAPPGPCLSLALSGDAAMPLPPGQGSGVSRWAGMAQSPLCPRDLSQPCPQRSSTWLLIPAPAADLGAAVVFRILFAPTPPFWAAVLGHPGWVFLPVPQEPSPGSW